MGLLINDGENGAGRVASLQLDGKRVCEKIAFCAPFILLQGIVKN